MQENRCILVTSPSLLSLCKYKWKIFSCKYFRTDT